MGEGERVSGRGGACGRGQQNERGEGMVVGGRRGRSERGVGPAFLQLDVSGDDVSRNAAVLLQAGGLDAVGVHVSGGGRRAGGTRGTLGTRGARGARGGGGANWPGNRGSRAAEQQGQTGATGGCEGREGVNVEAVNDATCRFDRSRSLEW